MKFNDILSLIDERKATSALILCHSRADPDAIGSAYALQGLLKKLKPELKVIIGTEKEINRLSKNVIEYVPISLDYDPELDQTDIIILIDTNTIQQLGNLSKKLAKIPIPIIVIDHHTINPKTGKIAIMSIIDESAPSTCEIVYGFYKKLKLKPNMNESKALFIGIASDTRHFLLGTSSTFKIISELCEIGVNPQEALTHLAIPMSFSERIARIKACKRVRIININEWIIALSTVSSYQSSSARAIMDLGAHLAIIAGKKGKKIEISLRSTKKFNKKTGIHLGKDIAQPLGDYLSGIGGGHASAAGVNGAGKIEDALNECLAIIRKILTNLT